MADYDLGRVAQLVIGGVVAWEGFYMVFKSLALDGASFHPFFSGVVGAITGTVMFAVGGLIAYGTYLEIVEDEPAKAEVEDDPFDTSDMEPVTDATQDQGGASGTVTPERTGTTEEVTDGGPDDLLEDVDREDGSSE